MRLTNWQCASGSYSWPAAFHWAVRRAFATLACSAASTYAPRASKTWRQAEVQDRPLRVRQARIRQELPLGIQILGGQCGAEQAGKLGVGGHVAKIAGDCRAEIALRPGKVALLFQDDAEIAVRRRQAGLDLNRCQVMSDCLAATALFVPGRGQSDVSFGKIGLQFDCPPVALEGFGKLSPLLQGVAQVVVGQGEARVELDGATVRCDCLVRFSLFAQGGRQVVAVVGAVRPEPLHLAEAGDGLVRIAHLADSDRQVRPNIDVIRLDRHRTPKGCDRLANFALLPQGVAQVVVGLGVVGRPLDRPAETGNRLFRPFQRPVGHTQVGMKCGNAAFQTNGAEDLFYRQIVLSGLKRHQAEQMPGVGILGGNLQDLSINFGCSIHVPCPVILQGKGQIGGLQTHRPLGLWSRELQSPTRRGQVHVFAPKNGPDPGL